MKIKLNENIYYKDQSAANEKIEYFIYRTKPLLPFTNFT